MWKPSPRPLIYPDHWALIDISRDAKLRSRMLQVLQRGTLLFSSMNLMETARSAHARPDTLGNIATFLDEVGDRWAPISLNSTEVGRCERAGILEPWRDERFRLWLRAPRVDGKLSKLVRRGEEQWVEDANERWEQEEAAKIGAMIAAGRDAFRKRTLKFERRTAAPGVLDTKALSDGVLQNYVCGSLNFGRNQIDDLMHTIVPVAHADVVFLDRPTKRELLKGLNTRAKVFWKGEIEAAFQHLENSNWE